MREYQDINRAWRLIEETGAFADPRGSRPCGDCRAARIKSTAEKRSRSRRASSRREARRANRGAGNCEARSAPRAGRPGDGLRPLFCRHHLRPTTSSSMGVIERESRHQPLQRPVLVLETSRSFGIGKLQVGVLSAPAVKRRLGHPMFPTELAHRRAVSHLMQNRDLLLVRKSAPTYASSRLTPAWTSNLSAGRA